MTSLSLRTAFARNVTVISNRFLDHFMPRANGDFVKVYLMLLRATGSTDVLTLTQMADRLYCTENDIRRALRYWESEGLLVLDKNNEGEITGITLTEPIWDNARDMAGHSVSYREPAGIRGGRLKAGTSLPASSSEAVTVSETPMSEGTTHPSAENSGSSAPEPSECPAETTGRLSVETSDRTAAKDSHFRAPKLSRRPSRHGADSRDDERRSNDIQEVLFIAEQYFQRTLSSRETLAIISYYDDFGFAPDLIAYLLEYCVNGGHKKISYIDSVAQAWYGENIRTVEEARAESERYSRCYVILKAFGIRNRDPIDKEKGYMAKWLDTWALPLDVVTEACSRAVMATDKNRFAYADATLARWRDEGVQSLDDVKELDRRHTASAAEEGARHTRIGSSGRTKRSSSASQMEQHEYDSDELEKSLLKGTH